eukprot:2715716-Amphidinium_carterae.1
MIGAAKAGIRFKVHSSSVLLSDTVPHSGVHVRVSLDPLYRPRHCVGDQHANGGLWAGPTKVGSAGCPCSPSKVLGHH